MITVTVTPTGAGHAVVQSSSFAQTTGEAETTVEDKGPSPIAPEVKEVAWGAGVVPSVVRDDALDCLVPRLKKGMDSATARSAATTRTRTTTRAAAKAEVADYEAELATVKAEVRQRIDAARQTLEAERTVALAEVNERIAARRAAAIAATDAARAAAAEHIEAAVVDVSSRAAELATGRRPDASAVNGIVSALIAGGGGR